MSSAPTKGAHVMIERMGQPFISLGGGYAPLPNLPPKQDCAGKAGA
jgi:hypothetical protein